MCHVTTSRIMTHVCLALPHITLWSLASSFDFLLCYDPFPTSDLFFFFSIVFGDPLSAPLLLSITCSNSSLILLEFFSVSTIFFSITSKSSWNMYQNNFSYFPPTYIFSCIFVHLSNSLHKLLNIIFAQSTSIPSSTFMNVNAFCCSCNSPFASSKSQTWWLGI